METQVLSNNNFEGNINGERVSGGLLTSGENINSYIVDSKFAADSGEAEIYICKKNGQKYVLKYYFNCKPKTEVIEKLKNFHNSDIVSLYEFGEYKDHFYEILEYAEGGSLDSKDSNGKYKYLPVTEETALQIVKETVNAFNECHKAGIIHRDIKPGNLFYKNKDGSNILVGDFGISSYYDVDEGMSKHLTQPDARTEGYTAPEVYTGLIGPEIDYYSLGVTTWELLTAKNPFMTVDEKPMFTASIIHETTQGKMADILLARAPQLSTRMKTLIKGLMTVRHEKRWDYDKVTKFLNGEDVPVYSETNQLPFVKVGDTECFSFKEIALAILSNKTAGKDFVYKGNLARYLVRVDKNLANEIADAVDEYSANDNLNEGLFKIAYRLCPNLEFKLSKKTSVSSIFEIIKVLDTKPREILPFLLDETKDFYMYLKTIGLEESAKKILQIVKTSNDESLIIPKLILAFNGNTVTPFNDGINDKIVLSDMNQVFNLSDLLKERLLLKIDANDRNICAWFENHTGKSIKDWRTLSFDIPFSKEVLGVSRWELFNAFLDEEYVPNIVDENTILDCIQKLKANQNYKTMNILIDITWKAFFNNGNYKTCSLVLNQITNNTEGLSKKQSFYMSKLGVSLYNLEEYKNAQQVFKSIQEEMDDFETCKYAALSFYTLQDYDEAFEYLNKALKLKADDFDLYNIKGAILFEKENFKEAAAAFSMAIDIRECKESYMFRARCYEELSKDGAPELKEKAEANRERAKRTPSNNFVKKLLLGRFFG